jgi:O-antigen ligase
VHEARLASGISIAAASVIIGIVTAHWPILTLVLLLVVVLAYRILRNTDVWQLLTIGSILSLVAASSNQPAVATTLSPFRFLLPAAVCFYLVLQPSRRQKFPSSVGYWATAVVLFTALSIFWSTDPRNSASQVVALGLTFAAIYLTATRRWTGDTMLRDLAVIYWTLVAIVAASVLAGPAGLPEARAFYGRYQGIFASANTLGEIAAMAIPLGLGLWATRRDRLIYLVGVAILLSGLGLAESRGAIGALALGGIFFAWRGGARGVVRYVVPAAAVLALAVALVAVLNPSAVAVDTLVQRFNAAGSTDFTNSRSAAWQSAINIWMSSPIIGHGYRTTEGLFQGLKAQGLLDFGPNTAHNLALEVAVELGIIGLVLVLGLLAAIVQAAGHTTSTIGRAAAVCVVVGLGTQLFESGLFGTGSLFAFLFWLVAAAAAVDSRRPPTEYADARDPP